VPSSGEPLEVYVDRSLGEVIVSEALRRLGLVVKTEVEVFGDVPQGVPDAVWLERAGRENWVVFTKDTRIRYRAAEISALAGNRVRAFVLSSGNLSGAEQAQRFVRNINRIRRACRHEGPFVYAVHANTIERLWPGDNR
jgi:hypothetical protein